MDIKRKSPPVAAERGTGSISSISNTPIIPQSEAYWNDPGPFKFYIENVRQLDEGTWVGDCPFCGGLLCFHTRKPEWKMRWRCVERCEGSRHEAPNGKVYHSGDWNDLKKLLAMKRRGTVQECLEGLMSELTTRLGEGYGFQVAATAVEYAVSHGLNLTKPFGVTFRNLARQNPKLDEILPDNRLRYAGYRIRKGLEELKQAGVTVTQDKPKGQPFGATRFDFRPLIKEPVQHPIAGHTVESEDIFS